MLYNAPNLMWLNNLVCSHLLLFILTCCISILIITVRRTTIDVL